MAETPTIRFRFGELTLADAEALATSAGNVTQAIREAIAYWRQAVESAGRQNAADLSREDWERLAHLNDPSPLPPEVMGEEDRAVAVDWSVRLAHELVGMWEGRTLILPLHREEAAACRNLAKRIARWGPVRGYALFACLRYFWRVQETPENWWELSVWLSPRAKTEE